MRSVVPLGIVLLFAVPAWAEDTDLDQTIADLGSQTGDKERVDNLGATKVEVSQVRGWLTDATNAVKEKEAKKARRCFDLIRAQMRLIDELITLSQIENEAARLEADIGRTRQQNARLKAQLDDKRVQIRALKLNEQREGKR